MSDSKTKERATFGTRRAFMIAAIGSAVGLGNIWRFPYIAFENGGGAFILPYLVALLTAGIPLLLLDYAIGHRYRGSAPLAFRRLGRWFEPVGWWNVMTNIVICIYYAVIIGWAASYTYYSVNAAWGADPQGFFFKDFLQMARKPWVWILSAKSPALWRACGFLPPPLWLWACKRAWRAPRRSLCRCFW